MTQITLATNTERKTVIVDVSTTLADILKKNAVDTTGATIMLKGQVCQLADQSRPLSELGVADGDSCILNVAVKAAAASKVKFEVVNEITPVLTVISDVTKEMVEDGISDLVARDENGNSLYITSYSNVAARIDDWQFIGNGYVDGKLAASIVLPVGTTKEDVMRMYGENLITFDKYEKLIAKEAEEKKATIGAIFE